MGISFRHFVGVLCCGRRTDRWQSSLLSVVAIISISKPTSRELSKNNSALFAPNTHVEGGRDQAGKSGGGGQGGRRNASARGHGWRGTQTRGVDVRWIRVQAPNCTGTSKQAEDVAATLVERHDEVEYRRDNGFQRKNQEVYHRDNEAE